MRGDEELLIVAGQRRHPVQQRREAGMAQMVFRLLDSDVLGSAGVPVHRQRNLDGRLLPLAGHGERDASDVR